MAIAALTPRVRTIVICDDIDASSVEAGVFTLEGVRCNIFARSLPYRTTLWVYLLLSSPRPGRFTGKISIVDEASDKTIRLVKFDLEFDRSFGLLPATFEIDNCVFSHDGCFWIQVHFLVESGDMLKGEHPLFVIADEE